MSVDFQEAKIFAGARHCGGMIRGNGVCFGRRADACANRKSVLRGKGLK